MKLTCRRDIEAPIAFVYAALKDFDTWERTALRRGAEVARTDNMREIAPGVSWLIKFQYRGKDRRLALRLIYLESPSSMALTGAGSSLDGQAGIDLIDLSELRTRLSVTLDLRPKTIGARLVLQAMRLAKARLNRQFGERVGQFSAEIEKRYRQSKRS